MNRMIAYFSLDGPAISREQLLSCKFNTPHWQPDHHDIYSDDTFGLSATQRFITPQCHHALMPYQASNHDYLINADVYLTNHDELCELLSVEPQLADAELILMAYLKWGQACTRYLAGQFCFMIADIRQKTLFAAVDQLGQCPLFYAYQAEKYFIAANEFSPFHDLCPTLTVNKKRFLEFAFDTFSATETSYHEVLKLPAGHQLFVTPQGMQQSCYWRLQDQKQKSPKQTRENYYSVFRQQFERAVQSCLRSSYPLMSQISGGLDSSAVTAQAAKLLAEQYQTLHTFTAIPNGLEGPSYRPHWYYHELPRVQSVLNQYPNIQHFTYRATPTSNIFTKLKTFYGSLDQPLRNIDNLDWSFASYDYALSRSSRLLLMGGGGNGSISWPGRSFRDKLRTYRNAITLFFKPRSLYHYFFARLNANVLNSAEGKKYLRHRGIMFNVQEAMLSGQLTASLKASTYAVQLWYGVRRLDPTQDLGLTVFCYNLPQWVYYKGKKILQRRLLVREGLQNLLPTEITLNPYRGEQAADWYLHYNVHQQIWQQQLQMLHPRAKEVLWQYYDHDKMMGLFQQYPYIDTPPNQKIIDAVCHTLWRCLSAAFYLNNFFNTNGKSYAIEK